MLEDAAPLRVAKRASGAVSPIPGTASLGHLEAFPVPTQNAGFEFSNRTFARQHVTYCAETGFWPVGCQQARHSTVTPQAGNFALLVRNVL